MNHSRQFHNGKIIFSSSTAQSTTEEDQSTQFRYLQRGLKLASPKLVILLVCCSRRESDNNNNDDHNNC